MYKRLGVINNTNIQEKKPGEFSRSSYGHYYEHANRLAGQSRIYSKLTTPTVDYWYSKSFGSIYGPFGDGISSHTRAF